MIPSRLQRYVLREALWVALISVVALTAMMFVAGTVQMVSRGISIIRLGDLIPFIMAISLPYALPSALLLAAVFVFGRLAGNNELNAMKSSGVNVNHVIFPMLALGILGVLFTFFLNNWMLPWSMRRLNDLKQRMLSDAVQFAGSDRLKYELGDYVIYANNIDPVTKELHKLAIIEFDHEIPIRMFTAETGTFRVFEEKSQVQVNLKNGSVLEPRVSEDADHPVKFAQTSYMINLDDDSDSATDRPKYMTYGKIVAEMDRLRKAAGEVRADPEFANVTHPKTATKMAAKIRNKAYREYDNFQNNLKAAARDKDKATDAAANAARELRGASSVYDSVATRLQDTENSAARKSAEYQQLLEEHKSLIDKKADPDQIESQRKEMQTAGEAADDLERRVKELRPQAALAQDKLKSCQAAMAARQAALDKAVSAYDAVFAQAEKARVVYEVENKRLNSLKLLVDNLRVQTDFYARNAGAFAALVFMLIGIPLGILSRHGHVIIAFVISFFAVLLVYYPLMIVGQMLSLDGFMSPLAAQWIANVATGGTGILLLIFGVRR